MKTIYAAQGNLNAYVELCRETELFPVDCEIIAGILQARRRPEQALEWVERGLDLEKGHTSGRGASYQLDEMKRKLLVKLGDSDAALASAWAEFEAFPSKLAYDLLMKYVPKRERAKWHTKAMNTSDQADLDFVIELWLATKEIDRLVGRLRRSTHQDLESISHYATEPAAKKLERLHPDIAAAKVYRAPGIRILNSRKSRDYDAALSHFKQARRCYKKVGDELGWKTLVNEVPQIHRRKVPSCLASKKLIQGKALAESSFAERTKRRKEAWN
ncbi:MAG: hypothetical protein IPM37_14050 [Hahellaceae bacterium]|nr:hypothetical protein [Hahellaceae bacterium]